MAIEIVDLRWYTLWRWWFSPYFHSLAALWEINIAMENHHLSYGRSTMNGPLSTANCNKLPEGSTLLNPIKPPFSYGFPMVFLDVCQVGHPFPMGTAPHSRCQKRWWRWPPALGRSIGAGTWSTFFSLFLKLPGFGKCPNFSHHPNIGIINLQQILFQVMWNKSPIHGALTTSWFLLSSGCDLPLLGDDSSRGL